MFILAEINSNGARSNQGDKKMLKWLYKMKDFYRWKGAQIRNYNKQEAGLLFLQGMTRVCQADYLTSTDQEIPVWLTGVRLHFWES